MRRRGVLCRDERVIRGTYERGRYADSHYDALAMLLLRDAAASVFAARRTCRVFAFSLSASPLLYVIMIIIIRYAIFRV